LDVLRRSALVALVNRKVFRPIGTFLAAILDRLQPLPDYNVAPPDAGQPGRALSPRRIASWALAIALAVLALIGLWFMVRLLIQVNLKTWGSLLLAAIF